jgi:periplasmic copper chaperone A
MKTATVARIFACLALWLTAAGAAEQVTVADAWIRATPPGVKTAAAYLTLTNAGAAEALVGAASPAARVVELHTSMQMNGMQHMQAVESIPLPTGTAVELAPGGLHIMLIDIAAPLEPGQSVPLTLRFASGKELALEVVVRDGRSATPL